MLLSYRSNVMHNKRGTRKTAHVEPSSRTSYTWNYVQNLERIFFVKLYVGTLY